MLAALLITSMQNDAMPLLNQEASGHLPQTVCRTGNEYSRHI
jgi:hypothetical protein